MAYSGRMKGHTTSLRFLKGVLCAFFILTAPVYSQQNVGIGTATPDSSAVLELSTQLLSSPKGFLVPRITSTQRNAISLPANGLLIYNTTSNQFEYNSGSATVPLWSPLLSSATSGTVTSVGLSLPSIFTVSGSPVTSSGTLSATLAVQVQNTVFAGPIAGANATPTFRVLDALDIPSLDAAKITSGILPIARGGTNSTATPTAGGVVYGTGTAYAISAIGTSGQVLSSNGDAAPSFRSLSASDISSGTLSVAQGGTGATTLSGILVGNGTSPFTARTLAGTSNQITLVNADGTAGNPTISITTNPILPGNASSSGSFTAGTGLTVTSGAITFSPFTTGILRSSAAGVITSSPITLSSGDITGTLPVANGGTGVTTITGLVSGNGTTGFVGRTITGTSNQISVTNGNGSTANPTLSITTNPVLPGNASSSGTFTAGTGLTVTSGGATISAGGINITGGLTVGTGTTTLLPLSTGIVHSSSTGVLSSSPVALATGDVSGILPVANGGTNSSAALNNNRIMVSSAGSIREAEALTNGQLLIGSTGAAPVAANITGTASQLDVTNGAGTIGLKLSDNSILPGTGSVTIPSGTTATRPASPENGMMRYNTTTGKFEFYQGDTWVNPLGASLSGGGTVNYLPKYNESTTLGNSNVYDNGTTVSIGNTSPTGTAALEVTSTTKGFLMPRMTEAQRDAIASPATGLMVYCTNGDQPGINYYDGVEWTRMIVENAPGSVHVVNKTSDQTGSGSMANDTYLFAPIGAYETWVIDGVIHVEAPTNQTIIIAFTHPTGASMKVGYHANTATANLQTGIITTSGATESISIKAGEPLVIFVKAVVIGQATAGNFQFTWNAPSSVTVKASSFFITSQGQ